MRGSRARGAGREGTLRVGTSGWQYPHWRGIFYPRGLAVRSWFDHYAGVFDTVEVNNTFYRLPEAHTFDAWRVQAPPGFVYALKFSRYATHLRRLLDPAESIGLFMERAERLGAHLGPILVQLPPRWRCDAGRLDRFLDEAPRSRRFAVELRDSSWLCPEVYEVLRRHRAALCIHDLIAGHPERLTADWVYRRFHGGSGGCYSPQKLAAVARALRRHLGGGLDVYAFFNNDAHGWAVANARALRRYAGVS
jgi:uncharacterized protein YecE (DUF72 family)